MSEFKSAAAAPSLPIFSLTVSYNCMSSVVIIKVVLLFYSAKVGIFF